MADFLLLWFWYLLAFGLGVAVTWLGVTRLVRPRTADQAVDEALVRHERSPR